jgi:hypothetical protein
LNLLDENFPADQTPLLKVWRIRFRKIGRDIGRLGTQDPDIIPLLHQVRGVTLFTQDKGLFNGTLCHSAYCIVCLDVRPDDAALYLCRVLRHRQFRSQASRMGFVIRAHRDGLEFWQRNRAALQRVGWHGPS